MATMTPTTVRRTPQTVTPAAGVNSQPNAFTGFNETAPAPRQAPSPGPFGSGLGTIGNQLTGALGATATGANTGTQNAAQSRNGLLDILNQDPSKTLGAYVQSAMPDFNKALQGVRENSIARGISTGDLGTSYEGDLASAFQRNIASQAAGLYGTRLGAAGQLYGQDSANALNSSNQYLGAVGDIQNQWLQQLMQGRAQNNATLGASIGAIGNLAGAAIMGG